MRNESAPSSSIRSASRSNWSATCSFLGSAAVTAAIIGRHVRATVCIPTYNERDNLEPMLRTLASILRDGDRVLVIDDASPDGTGELADRLAAELPFVDVLHRQRKEGLGPAYLAGFRHVLETDAELVLEMDCDFSHDPKDLLRLIAAAEGGADVAVGSRYVGGGSIPAWGAVRRVVSFGGSVYARLALGVHVRDLTAGFKCFRRVVLETIDIVEIPITFVDREQGGSKMHGSIVLEAMWRVPLLRVRALRGRL